ncbi:MAG: GNAT family N-acetyltransferase [Firmicutes bacterium]|nr:GNAT family N-acetyltransferase [Bacillota bacterium]
MITINRVNKEEKYLLDNLLQLYLHDISLYFPMDFDSKEGKYIYDDLSKYFDGSNNYAYLLKDDENIIGFSLVDTTEDNTMVIQEMFILNNYKSKGYGKEIATKIFDMHKGNWVVKALPCSPKAENFWKRTIEEYTNNTNELEYIGKYNRAVFKFNNEKIPNK